MNHTEQMAWQRAVIGEEALDFLQSLDEHRLSLDEDEIDALIQQRRGTTSSRKTPFNKWHRIM